MVTGHTGFKGSWLSLWLQRLGADVRGYSLDVPTQPSLYDVAEVGDGMDSIVGDVRDLAALRDAVRDVNPEIIIHMAAQSLVRRSYADPAGTYATNVMGTVNVLEAARHADGVRVVIIVTSDKCYENLEREHGYVEHERMGGRDPYSSSKGCAELVTAAYRHSFFNGGGDGHARAGVASVRAGNVIGGGDWAEDRLIPDVLKAFQAGTIPALRNARAIRPWQFVLDPLNGYLTLAERIWAEGLAFEGAWNFGPEESDAKEVAQIVDRLLCALGSVDGWRQEQSMEPHEATCLRLDSSKAKARLSWAPALDVPTTLDWIVEWYRSVDRSGSARSITLDQIERFQRVVQR